jgi:hypothetical protein
MSPSQSSVLTANQNSGKGWSFGNMSAITESGRVNCYRINDGPFAHSLAIQLHHATCVPAHDLNTSENLNKVLAVVGKGVVKERNIRGDTNACAVLEAVYKN